MRKQPAKTSEEMKPAITLISDFQPPELKEHKFLCIIVWQHELANVMPSQLWGPLLLLHPEPQASGTLNWRQVISTSLEYMSGRCCGHPSFGPPLAARSPDR